MTERQARGMLTMHQRMARAYRAEAADAGPKVRAKLLRDADVADRRAAECQAVLQVASYGRALPDAAETMARFRAGPA